MIKKCLIFIVFCFPAMLYAQSDIVELTKEVIRSEVPLLEKILLGFFGLLFIALGIFLWKGLPKMIDRYQLKKDQQLDEKIKNAEDIEVESNRLIKEVKTTIDRLVACHEENKSIIEKHDKDIGEIKDLLNEDMHDRKARQEEMDAWRGSIETKIESIITTQTDQGHYIRSVSIGTLENMLDSAMVEIENKKKGEKVNLKRVRNGLKAFLKLVGLKRNSYNLKNGYALIIEFKDDFEVIFEDFAKENWKDIEMIDEGYFAGIMDEISALYGRKLKFHITKKVKEVA